MLSTSIWVWLESLPISVEIGGTWLFPLCESIHVLAATFVVGSILMLDLRLLGLAGRAYAVSQLATDIIPWTLGAFFLALLSGLGMFITQASRYMDNRAFQVKLVLLCLAVANMALFHRWTTRTIARWDAAPAASPAARLAGACSLLLWVGVMLAGRWTGHLL